METTQRQYSLEELLSKTKDVQKPYFVRLANEAGTPSYAQRLAEDHEFPSSVVRKIWLLGVLKRDYPDEFKDLILTHLETFPSIPLIRRFKCHYGKEDHETPGMLTVHPHTLLPPLFWEYEVQDLEGNPIKDGARCVLSEGSKSLPVNMVMLLEESGTWKSIHVTRMFSDYEIIWKYSASLENDQIKEAHFERTVSFRDLRGIIPIVQFRKMREQEMEMCDIPLNSASWGLFLYSKLFYHIKSSDLSNEFKVISVYQYHKDWKTQSKELWERWGCRKVMNFLDPDENSFQHVLISLRRRLFGRIREYEDSLNNYVEKAVSGSPNVILGLETLHNFFSFKRIDPWIFNHGDSKPLKVFR